jgi:hypothetical protein
MHPRGDVASIDGQREQVRERIGGAGEGRHPEFGERSRVAGVEHRRPSGGLGTRAPPRLRWPGVLGDVAGGDEVVQVGESFAERHPAHPAV